MNQQLDRHRTRIGAERKQVAEYVAWAREAIEKCRTDAERATLLRTLLRLTEGLG
tara:strand:- start:391 stop:555 length:165 start_codon:yes stop_codon:yes gene_type:complete